MEDWGAQPCVGILTKGGFYARILALHAEAWCSGLAYLPVKQETAGSNPVASASR